MRFLPLAKEDIPLLLPLTTRIKDSPLDEKTLLAYLLDPNMQVFVLRKEKEERLSGYLVLRLEGTEAEIDEIALSQEDEGKGYGSLLLEEGLRWLKEKGLTRVLLEVRSLNTHARAFYARHGFVCYRKRKGYYPDDDALCLRKEISL